MGLPVLNLPEFSTTVPSTGKTVMFRPFLVKEEKVLLMALEGGDIKDVTSGMISVINSCFQDIKAENLPVFDIEYLFLQLRAKSVNEVVNLQLRHKDGDCKAVTEYTLNLEEIGVQHNPNHSQKIMLTDSVGITMKYPTLKSQGEMDSVEDLNNIDKLMEFVARSIDIVFDPQNVYEDFTPEEALNFVEGLNKEQFGKILKFFDTIPKVSYDIEYTCKECGKQESIHLEGINNFFA